MPNLSFRCILNFYYIRFTKNSNEIIYIMQIIRIRFHPVKAWIKRLNP
ncbi:hypothetical protein CLOSTASPAR_04476 [[Clostridium] asparagiforme DSM 15981]|uniref:Uncharacterized protein n=1 Tax=[Clostridium] asparagiforme DSM 15981 TaxID=518636 RepID=C0D5D1_9FIRM|nr:hypothetical protein CLOSTASPAR_04476 [[Clostridium] asparagiforme DSM 15981]